MPPESNSNSARADHAPLERLLAALPLPVQRAYRWICQPRLIWLRVPVALLLMVGGCLGFLPILGFWMLPVGILLLAEDVPVLQRPAMRALGSVQGWWDKYRNRKASC